MADLVDNSIEANATEVRVDIVFEGLAPGFGSQTTASEWTPTTITESLRIGSIRDYDDDDLGKFGFGLKTASISQCRRVVDCQSGRPPPCAH